MGRRRKGDLPAYRKHAGGQSFLVHENQTHWLGKFGTPASRAKYRRVCEELDLGVPEPEPAAGRLTIDQIWIAWTKSTNRKHTDMELDRLNLSTTPVRDLYGTTFADEFGPRALRKVRDKMLAEGLAAVTANQRIGRVKRWLRWAVAEELVPETVWRSCEALENLPAKRRRVRPAADAVVDATIPFCRPNLAAMIRVHRLTGLRSENVCAMTADQIDRKGEIWIYWPREHKTDEDGRALFVALRPSVRVILEPLLAGCAPDEPFFSPKKGAWRKDRRHTDRWTSETYYHAVVKAIARGRRAKVDIPHWHPHQLRHALGTEVREKAGAEASQNALGHAHLSTTEIYAERSLAEAIRIARELG